MLENGLPKIREKINPITNEITYTFDFEPYIRQLLSEVMQTVETLAEKELVQFLRDKGYLVVRIPEVIYEV